MTEKSDIGVIGLAVMGENLVLNMATTDSRWRSSTGPCGRGRVYRRPRGGQRSLARTRSRSRVGPRETATGDDDGQGRKAGGRVHRAAHATPRPGRHHHRRRQLELQGHRFGARSRSKKGTLLRRHRRVRRRGGCPARPVASCRAVRRTRGRGSNPYSRRSRQKRTTASPAAIGSAKTAPGTTSRWSTTASSTATCSSSARATT